MKEPRLLLQAQKVTTAKLRADLGSDNTSKG